MNYQKVIGYGVFFLVILVPAFLILSAVYSFLPLIILVLLILSHFIYFKIIKKDGKYPKKVIVGLLILTTFGSCFSYFFYEANFFGMGPFYSEKFEGNLDTLVPRDSIPYRSGHLITYKNENVNEPAIVVYKSKDDIVWAEKLNAPDIFWVENNDSKPFQMAYEVRFSSVDHGIIRDTVGFFAVGHSEPGRAFLWRFGGIQKFFIMSF